jgi:hypothetical protein
MLVQVKWKNGGFDYVRGFMLDCLLQTGVVESFLRSSGWVTLGLDPVRSTSGGYDGPERRSANPSPEAGQSPAFLGAGRQFD